MTPLGTRVWRKGYRRALRGVPTGRRATRPVETTYGRNQRDRDWRAAIDAARAQFREQTEVTS